MGSNLRDLRDRQAGVSERNDAAASPAPDGLSADELRAEQAGELPEREAMSILDVGDIGAGLPSPADIAGQFGSIIPPGVGPVDGPIDPIEMAGQLPVDITGQLPTGDLPTGTVPANPDDGDLIGIPETGLDDSDETLA
jgi:hypothetical protein